MSHNSARTASRRLWGWGRALFTAALLMVIINGCSKSPTGPSEEDAAMAQQLADEGFDLLAATFSGPGADLSAAQAKFEQALELDPNNADANVGMAVINIAGLSSDPQVLALFGGTLPGTVIGRALPEGNGFARVLSGPVGDAGAAVFTPAGVLDATQGRMMRMMQDGPPFSDVQDVAEQVLLPVLTAVVNFFEIVEGHDTWSHTFTAAQTGSTPVEIDITDVYLLDAVFHALKAQIHFLVSYDVDITFTGTPADTTEMQAKLDQTDGTFLTLRTNGATNMGLARSTLLEAIDRADQFRLHILAETDDQSDDLIKVDPTGDDGPTSADLTEMGQELAKLNLALAGAIPVEEDFNDDGSPETMNINLRALFDSPIQDWKQTIPDYQWNSMYMTFVWDAWLSEDFNDFVFPNPTFNGLFPSLTTDAAFKTAFGIDMVPDIGPFGYGGF